jgi:hypothetical protein
MYSPVQYTSACKAKPSEGISVQNGRMNYSPLHMYSRATIVKKSRLLGRMMQFVGNIALCSNIEYAVVNGRKGRNRRKHGRDVCESHVFLIESDQHVCSKEKDATCQSYCRET